jgi:hypothetical protein
MELHALRSPVDARNLNISSKGATDRHGGVPFGKKYDGSQMLNRKVATQQAVVL